jgi:hypothetical protein
MFIYRRRLAVWSKSRTQIRKMGETRLRLLNSSGRVRGVDTSRSSARVDEAMVAIAIEICGTLSKELSPSQSRDCASPETLLRLPVTSRYLLHGFAFSL